MKKFLVTVALLGFGFSAQADHHYELQINGGFGGTSGNITINDDDNGDNNPWSIGAEIYKSMTDKFQIGGLIAISDADTEAITVGPVTVGQDSETMFTLGVLGRYNLDSELRESMFFGGGLTYTDAGNDVDLIALHVSAGKRYAISDSITYTPNIALQFNVGGERGPNTDQEGMVIVLNLLSFSGFM